MEKYCHQCKESKDVACFAKASRKKDGLQTMCRECKKAYDADYFQENKAAQNERNKKNRLKFKGQVDDYKKAKGCICCSEKDPCCLDFHHPEGNKEECVSNLLKNLSVRRLQEEIKKCVVICSNCHRKLHAGVICEKDVFQKWREAYSIW